MDAVKFLKEQERLCDSNGGNCEDCPLEQQPCLGLNVEAEELVSIVEKWSAEHPVKTRLMDFSEKYPKAIDEDGLPVIWYPISLGYCDYDRCGDCPHGDMSQDQRKQCWNLPLEE